MLSEYHVQVLLKATQYRLIGTRAWLLDAMTVTNEKDIEFRITKAVKPGDIVSLSKDECSKPGHMFTPGEIVGVNGKFTAGVLEKDQAGMDQLAGVILSKNTEPAFHRLDVFEPVKYLALAKSCFGVNNCTISMQTCGKTTVGRWLENMLVLQIPTQFKFFKYLNEVWTDKMILKVLTDAVYNKAITVEEYKKCIDYFFFLNHTTEICVPSLTERSLMTDPRVPAVKKKFIAEHQGQMNDPIIIKQLEDELAALDREWLGKGTDHEDPSVTFFDGLGSKSYGIHRKKLFLTTGGIPAFEETSGKFDFIPNSLSEGWTTEAIPSIANEIRKGSYERGRETAKGGAETKLVMRVFQDLMVTHDDCGTKRTTPFDFKDTCDIKDFIGRTINWHGQDIELTEENIKKFDGQVLNVYSPMTCATPYDLCYKCCGRRAKELGAKVIGIQVVNITSKFMQTAMKSMHGTELKITQPKLENILL